MNARELIVSNCMGEWNFVNAMIAAERVVERLQNRVDELMVSAHPIQTVQSKRERYRDRLDRMVAALVSSPRTPFQKEIGTISGEDYVEAAKIVLAAIDAEVEK